jgi:hypothetical protein
MLIECGNEQIYFHNARFIALPALSAEALNFLRKRIPSVGPSFDESLFRRTNSFELSGHCADNFPPPSAQIIQAVVCVLPHPIEVFA